MDNLSEDVRADFLNGSNGAVVSFFFFKKKLSAYPAVHTCNLQ